MKLRGKRGDLKVSIEEVSSADLAQFKEVGLMKKSLKETLSYREILEEKALSLKDVVVVTFTRHFERVKRHTAFFYPNLDLSRMDLFQVVKDVWLVDGA